MWRSQQHSKKTEWSDFFSGDSHPKLQGGFFFFFFFLLFLFCFCCCCFFIIDLSLFFFCVFGFFLLLFLDSFLIFFFYFLFFILGKDAWGTLEEKKLLLVNYFWAKITYIVLRDKFVFLIFIF